MGMCVICVTLNWVHNLLINDIVFGCKFGFYMHDLSKTHVPYFFIVCRHMYNIVVCLFVCW